MIMAACPCETLFVLLLAGEIEVMIEKKLKLIAET